MSEPSKIDVDAAHTFIRAAQLIPNWFSSQAFDLRGNVGKFSVRLEMRRSDGMMGRFGGGWNWKLGIQIGGSTVIISLVVASLTISRQGKP